MRQLSSLDPSHIEVIPGAPDHAEPPTSKQGDLSKIQTDAELAARDAELAARDAELAARDAIIKSILLNLSLK